MLKLHEITSLREALRLLEAERVRLSAVIEVCEEIARCQTAQRGDGAVRWVR